MKICKLEGCESKSRAKGWCNTHYQRWYKFGDPDALAPKMTTIERFMPKVVKTDECWLWVGAINSSGYGNFNMNGRIQGAHRVAWQLKHGTIPDALHVLHHCDNRRCVNVSHMMLGTNADNVQDKINKGRQAGAVGEKNTNAKLDAGKVRKIRESSATTKQLASVYGVSNGAIWRARTMRTWRHVL